MPYFEHAFKNENLNSHRAGYGYFKGGTPGNSDLFHCGKAVAFPDKKYSIIIIIIRWRFSGMSQFPKITEYHSK